MQYANEYPISLDVVEVTEFGIGLRIETSFNHGLNDMTLYLSFVGFLGFVLEFDAR